MQLNWMNDGGSFKPMPVCTEPFPERYYLSGSGLIVDEGNSADAEHMQFVSMMAFISLIGFIFMLDQNSASRDEDPANLYYEDI